MDKIMNKRKSVFELSTTEKENFIKAFLLLKSEIVNPEAPVSRQFNLYDQFVAIHGIVMKIEKKGWKDPIDYGHNGLGFLPWHRVYLRYFELALQSKVPSVTLPYWDWTQLEKTRNKLFTDDFLSPLSDRNGLNYITSGYFVPEFNGDAPNWWDDNIKGFKINALLDAYRSQNPDGFLIRSQGIDNDPWPLTQSEVSDITEIDFDFTHDYFEFRNRLESGGSAHNSGHRWIGGHMDTGHSPNDPIFWLHHSQVDRLWSLWQNNVATGVSGYPTVNIDPSGNEIPPGHKLYDRMWPWVGNEKHLYKPLAEKSTHFMLPDYDANIYYRPVDVLDHKNLPHNLGGYEYE